MKTLFLPFLILFLNISLAQTNTTSEITSKCNLKMSKQTLLAEDNIELNCLNFYDNNKFGIHDFSIKFPGHPTEIIKGSGLNAIAKSYVNTTKIGNIVTIFDINEIYDGEKQIDKKGLKIITITLVE